MLQPILESAWWKCWNGFWFVVHTRFFCISFEELDSWDFLLCRPEWKRKGTSSHVPPVILPAVSSQVAMNSNCVWSNSFKMFRFAYKAQGNRCAINPAPTAIGRICCHGCQGQRVWCWHRNWGWIQPQRPHGASVVSGFSDTWNKNGSCS